MSFSTLAYVAARAAERHAVAQSEGKDFEFDDLVDNLRHGTMVDYLEAAAMVFALALPDHHRRALLTLLAQRLDYPSEAYTDKRLEAHLWMAGEDKVARVLKLAFDALPEARQKAFVAHVSKKEAQKAEPPAG